MINMVKVLLVSSPFPLTELGQFQQFGKSMGVFTDRKELLGKGYRCNLRKLKFNIIHRNIQEPYLVMEGSDINLKNHYGSNVWSALNAKADFWISTRFDYGAGPQFTGNFVNGLYNGTVDSTNPVFSSVGSSTLCQNTGSEPTVLIEETKTNFIMPVVIFNKRCYSYYRINFWKHRSSY